VWLLDGKCDEELGAVAQVAFYFDAPPVVFDDAARQRETEASAIAFGRVERAEDEGQVFRRGAAALIRDRDQRLVFFCRDDYLDRAGSTRTRVLT
jgi:hypothetical protein